MAVSAGVYSAKESMHHEQSDGIPGELPTCILRKVHVSSLVVGSTHVDALPQPKFIV